jgi:hypothetical protein
MPGTYSNPYTCGKMHTGETSHSIDTRINEYHCHIQLYQPDKLCIANIMDLGHQIASNTTSIPSRKSRKLECLTREATENKVHPNVNRVDRFALSRTW